MSHVSHRLKNAFEGALAGGGDPASSPLSVSGFFLKLLAVGFRVVVGFVVDRGPRLAALHAISRAEDTSQ